MNSLFQCVNMTNITTNLLFTGTEKKKIRNKINVVAFFFFFFFFEKMVACECKPKLNDAHVYYCCFDIGRHA